MVKCCQVRKVDKFNHNIKKGGDSTNHNTKTRHYAKGSMAVGLDTN